MLNGVHAGFGRPQNSLGAVGVGRDPAAEAVGVGDDGFHFFDRVLRGAGIVAFGEHAAGGANFDHVRAVLDDLTDFVLHAFHAVGRAVALGVKFVGQQVLVAVSAGDAERRSARDDVRSRQHAFVDGVA